MDDLEPRKPVRKGIQSIEVGFSILTVLMEAAKPLPLKTISERSGLSPSKVHSYLVSFCALDVVVQHRDMGTYGIGPYALKLGLAFLDQFDLFSTARPEMIELADALGATVFLGVWGNRGPTIIYRVDGALSHTVLDIRVGSVLPVLRSAVGLNLAAHLPQNITRHKILEELEQLSPKNTGEDNGAPPSTLLAVHNVLDMVRKDGFSQCRGGLLSDFTAISAPIFDYSGAILGALTVMGPINRFDDTSDGEPVKKLKRACANISATCGYSPLTAHP